MRLYGMPDAEGSTMDCLPHHALLFLARGCVLAAILALTGGEARSATPSKPPGTHDVAVDVIQADGGRLYHLDAMAGLLVYDVSDPDRPQPVGRYAVEGWPLGLVVRGRIAALVMRFVDLPSVRGGSTPGPAAVLLVDIGDPRHPRLLQQSTIDGVIDDARVADASLYVLSRPSTGMTVSLSVYDLDGWSGWEPSTLRRDGTVAALRVVDGQVVLAYEKLGGGTRLELFAQGTSGFAPRGHLDLAAHLERFERDVSERLDARDASRVRVMGCRTAACGAGDTLEIATVDATDPSRPRLVSTRSLASPGRWLATRFADSELYLSSRGWYGLGAPVTSILRLSLDGPADRDSVIRVQGAVVWNIASLGPRLLVIGTRGNLQTHTQQLVIDLLPRADRPADAEADSYAVLGQGWASSPAEASSHALSVCGDRLGVALRTWDEHTNPQSAVALLEQTANGLAPVRETRIHGFVERLACVKGRLFALSDAGLWPVDSPLEPSRARSFVAP